MAIEPVAERVYLVDLPEPSLVDYFRWHAPESFEALLNAVNPRTTTLPVPAPPVFT